MKVEGAQPMVEVGLGWTREDEMRWELPDGERARTSDKVLGWLLRVGYDGDDDGVKTGMSLFVCR